MTSKRLITCAALALAAAFPAAAAAQSQVPPPQGDNYLQPLALQGSLSSPSVLPYNDPIGFVADTSTYTTQPDLFNPPASGGPAEITQCGSSNFANTIWTVFYAHHWGHLNISTAGSFDSVIAFVPFRSPNNPAPLYQLATCVDRLSGLEESDSEIVFPGSWWAIDVGGTGAPTGGTIQEKYELKKPTQVSPLAFLFWKTGPLRVTSMTVKKVPSFATVKLSCTKGACRNRTIRVKGKPALSKLFTSTGLVRLDPSAGARMKGAGAGSGGRLQEKRLARAAAESSPVRAAAKNFTLLTNKKVKPGARIELRVTRFGYFGKYYRWNVQRNGISNPTIRCMNPGSNTPRKKCHG